MVNIRKNGNKLSYGLKHYVLDEYKDFEELKFRYLKPGSTAFVISTSKRYILNSEYEWIEVKTTVSGGSSGGNGGTGNDTPDYDGGSIDGSDPSEGDGLPDYDGGNIDGSDPS